MIKSHLLYQLSYRGQGGGILVSSKLVSTALADFSSTTHETRSGQTFADVAACGG